MKKLIIVVLVLVAAGAAGWAYYVRQNKPNPEASLMALSRGDVVESVGATGTLEAVETVDVGTQVSGVVQALYADFNSIVKKGQIIARLDPQIIETQIEQQTANVVRAEADLDRLKVSLEDAKQKLERAKAMADKQLIPRTELETAEVNVKSIDAQIRSSQAGLQQARAQLNNQKVNLGYTTITAPIDGIIISRNVDQGQTVAASMNAPTLYIIAADLTKMQVVANIDEADVGRMRPGQVVTFRVDAYPTETFVGSVSQVRLQPAVVQNVVTYSTVITVPNPDLKLKPGMTANVTIEVARKNNALRIPNRALAFRPTPDMFQVLNQPLPPELERGRGFGGGFGGGGGGGRRNGGGGGQAPAAAPGANARPAGQAPAAQQGPERSSEGAQATAQAAPQNGNRDGMQARAGNGTGVGGGRGEGRGGFDPNMSPEERQRRREERLKNMSPEERAAFEARMREGGGRGFGGGGGFGNRAGGAPNIGFRGNRDGGARAAANTNDQISKTMASGATTIDALFAPIQTQERPGMAWTYQANQLKPLRLRLGLSDGTHTEIVNESEIPANTEVVVTFTTGLEPKNAPGQQNQQNNPLMGPQRGGGGRGPGGGGGGGGRGRG